MVSSVEMAPAAAALGGGVNFEDFERDLELMLREGGHSVDIERDVSLYRSGSAPPTVEGVRGGYMAVPAEEAMRSHPDYSSYYYSKECLNPRLPPPVASKEDWRASQRFRGLGGAGDRGCRGSSMLHGLPYGVVRRELNADGAAALERSVMQQRSDSSVGARRKSFADALQEEFIKPASVSEHLSRPASRNSFDNMMDPVRISDSHLSQLHAGSDIIDGLHFRSATPHLGRVHSLGSQMSQSFASALSSPVRSSTGDRRPIGRSPSPCFPPIGRVMETEKNAFLRPNGLVGATSRVTEAEMASPLSQEISDETEFSGILNNFVSYNDLQKEHDPLVDLDLSKLNLNGQVTLQKPPLQSNIYKQVAAASTDSAGSSSHYHNVDVSESNSNAYSTNQRLLMMNKRLDTAGSLEGIYLNRTGTQLGAHFQAPIGDPLYSQYMKGASDLSMEAAAASRLESSLGRNYLSNSNIDLTQYQKLYLEALLAQQELQYDTPLSSKSASLSHGYYGMPTFGLGMAYPTGPLSSSILSSLGHGSAPRHSERIPHYSSIARGALGAPAAAWNPENGVIEEGYALSLLDEFKNNKTRSYELLDIVGHVVEFSADQFGSRFIQQKLETATVEEKNNIFPEILPHARALMNDVFGNYVIQKFFEHGTESQRMQLASQLIGHVLPLSLQMYGCRVIQKALEVVDIDYQISMVLELDGSVMKCVRDQNGNHVIQKCIECVPQDKIQFIISAFYGQVVALSTHPYGCRVIQRVLEHCDNAKTQSIMMDEILQSVSTLAQDQYGNYVVQHVLQHGKPEERSAVIIKLAGQIVRMSQQKFASNVVEKCLTYGRPDECQLLIDEMIGTTDENEPLQAMMKDQFGNYVVQKVLETCENHNRELILSRIKVHLNTLKKYTYGKHIVARVEKLIATGERCSGNAFLCHN